jgi:hypothetical protein
MSVDAQVVVFPSEVGFGWEFFWCSNEILKFEIAITV